MYVKSDFIPESKPLVSNYIVISNAKLIKDGQKALKNVGPIKAKEPLECFKHCTKVSDYRCNIVEYNHVEKLCKFYDLPKDEHTTLKFNFSNNELIGESFTASTIESLRKKDITKEECINMFNNNTKSIFYNYKQDGSYTECIVGLATVSNDNSFVINLNSFNKIKYIGSNVKYQIDTTNMAGISEDQKKGSIKGNNIPHLFVALGILGIIIICGLIYYGILMVKRAKNLNDDNEKSINIRNKISHKIKASDQYSKGINGSKGSKNSTLNNSKRSQHSQLSEFSYNLSSFSLTNKSQHLNVSNIAPQIYDYNDSFTFVNNSYTNSLSNNEQSNSVLNNSLQDFYNNASLSYDVPNHSKSNYSSINRSYPNHNGYTSFSN